jgi:myosin heavy subunit
MVILGLNEKLKTLQMVHQEVMKLRGELHESHELRRQLESSVSETTEQLKRQSAKQDELHTHLIQERQAAVESLRLQHLKYREKCQDEDRLMGEIAKLKGTIQKLLAEAANYAQMKAHIEALKSELDESERQRQLLRQQYGKSAQEFEARVKENMLMQARLSSEKEALQGEVQRLQAALHAQRTENDRLSQDNATVKGKVSQLEADLATYADQKRSLEETQQLSDQSHDNAVTVEVKMQEAAGEFSRRLEEVMQQNLRLQEEKGKVTAALNDVENTVELKNEQIQDLTREKMELTAAIATLEQLLVVQEDLRQIADTVSAQNAANTSLKDQLLKELGSLSQTLLQQSEKSLAANRLVVRLREMTDDKEAEVASLRRLVTELKQQRPIYVAVAEDPVDQAIATFSNSQSKVLPVPLLREDQGTYVFGSRRVFVKLEEGQVIVRVGGGFIPLEEFITTYTDLELDKLQARESELTTRHQSLLRKLASQAAVESLQSKTEASPSKAAKLMKDYFASSLFPSGRTSLSPGRLSYSPQ